MCRRQNQLVRSLLGLCLLLSGQLSHAAESAPAAEASRAGESLAEKFWQPRAQLPAQQLLGLPEYCTGAYQWPQLKFPVGVDDSTLPTQAEAQTAQYLRSGEITLSGDVVVSRGNRTLTAPAVSINSNSLLGHADDGVLMEEEDFIVAGQQAQMNFDTSAAFLADAEYLYKERGIRGQAARIEQDENGNLEVTRTAFTSCEPGNQTWQISARRLTIEDGEIFGKAKDAVLRVGNVPVFYTPYLRFPVSDERQSGWLLPTFAYNDVGGLDLAIPYYLNLAENYDATIIPRYIRDRGIGVETEFRTLTSWQASDFNFAYMPKDDLYNGTYTRQDWDKLEKEGLVSGEFNPADRWLYAMYHSGRIGQVRTLVDYTAVSDRDYFRDLDTTLKVSKARALERRGEALLDLGDFSMRLWAQRFDRLDEIRREDYQRLPELDLSYRGELPGPFEFAVGASAVRFDRKNQDLVGFQKVVGERYYLDPRLRLPLSRPWGYLNLTGGYRLRQYSLDDTEGLYEDHPDRTIGLASADMGLFFERDLELFDTALVQTLEPRLYYLYQQNQNQDDLPIFDTSQLTFQYDQLFRDNRFAGIDRIGDANQLSTGLTSRFLKPETGREVFRASIGTIVYFKDREVTLGPPTDADTEDTSAVAAELSTTVGNWRLTGSMIYDPHNADVEEGGGYLQYRSDNDHIFNLGYRYRSADKVDQTDFSFIWPVTPRYGVIGRWNYDIESGRTIEALGGIEYNNCCWQVRLVGRRFIDSPSAREIENTDAEIGAFIQVVFKGLAGVGTKIESLLETSIRGYREEK
jgi:LPS-assembly protein